MCGIAGYFGTQKITAERCKRTLQLMRSRGPDFQNLTTITTGRGIAHLLHSRLSIIDLDSRSNQPFQRGGVSLVFNGEIYNYPEIRDQLKKRGVEFTTDSDTEVLIQSYLLSGIDCLNNLEGMWSFALYDSRTDDLYLARDRFGEKPLYYSETNSGVFFGSEIKFISSLTGTNPPINREHIARYLVYGFRSLYQSGATFFHNIREVPAGSFLHFPHDKPPSLSRYWSLTPQIEPGMTFVEAVSGTKERLLKSLELRLRADVPLAFCLSGGVDSALLVSCAAKLFGYKVTTFSIVDSDPRYNEEGLINKTIQDVGCAHNLVHISRMNFMGKLNDLIQYHDGPLSTISYFVHALLCEEIKLKGFKVVLSGTGADEIFTGYYDHFLFHLAEAYGTAEYPRLRQDWESYIRPLTRNPALQDPDVFSRNPTLRNHLYLDSQQFASALTTPFTEHYTEHDYSASLLRNRMMNELFREIVPVILHEDDLNSMRCSLENRSPYLDRSLVEFGYSIPSIHLIRNGYAKAVLREVGYGILNDDVRLARRKTGFNCSIESLVDFSDHATMEFILAKGPLEDYVDFRKARSLLASRPFADHMNKFAFNLINCKLFLESFG